MTSRPWLAIFHPAFDVVGGAELLAATHARALREHVATAIQTFVYNPAIWQSRIGEVPVITRNLKLHKSDPCRVTQTMRTEQSRWAEREFRHWDTVVAYNFPSSAILGMSDYRGRRIWHCCEPPRSLHPERSNPYTWNALRKHALHPPMAIRQFAIHLYGAMVLSKTLRTNKRAQSSREDLEGIKGLPEIWALSEFTRDNIRAVYGPREVSVVYPMVTFPRTLPRPSGVRQDLRILMLSRLEAMKNIDTVLRGFALFHAKHPGATLEIVGVGPAHARLQHLARHLGLPERSVQFHGFLLNEELENLALQCDVFVCLPLDEPFGMVFPEAAARGLILVAPSHGGPREIVDDGKLGLMVDPLCPDELLESLERIVCMPDAEVDALRQKANDSCRARFGHDAILARLRELLGKG